MVDNIQVNAPEGKEVLVIREGEAPKLHESSGWEQQCHSFRSIVDFFQKRSSTITAMNSVLHVDYETAKMSLIVNDGVPSLKTVLTAKLKESKDYVDLGINGTKTFSEKELENALRTRPHLFRDVESYNKVLESLRNFTSDVRKVFTKEDNRSGSSGASVKVDIKTDNLQKDVELKLSAWNGMPARIHSVKIYVTEDAGYARFYLECVDLRLEQEAQKIGEIDSAVKEMSAKIPVIVL